MAENLNADLGPRFTPRPSISSTAWARSSRRAQDMSRGNGDYVKSLGVSRPALAYGTISLGFVFIEQYMITASKAVLGPTVITNSPWQVGVTIVRLPSTP